MAPAASPGPHLIFSRRCFPLQVSYTRDLVLASASRRLWSCPHTVGPKCDDRQSEHLLPPAGSGLRPSRTQSGPGPCSAAGLRTRPPEMLFLLFCGLLGCILEGTGGPRIFHLDREVVLDEEEHHKELGWFSGGGSGHLKVLSCVFIGSISLP